MIYKELKIISLCCERVIYLHIPVDDYIFIVYNLS